MNNAACRLFICWFYVLGIFFQEERFCPGLLKCHTNNFKHKAISIIVRISRVLLRLGKHCCNCYSGERTAFFLIRKGGCGWQAWPLLQWDKLCSRCGQHTVTFSKSASEEVGDRGLMGLREGELPALETYSGSGTYRTCKNKPLLTWALAFVQTHSVKHCLAHRHTGTWYAWAVMQIRSCDQTEYADTGKLDGIMTVLWTAC